MSSFGSSDGEICQTRLQGSTEVYEQNYYPLYQTLEPQTYAEMLPMEEGYWGSPCSSGSQSVRGVSPHDGIERSPTEAPYPLYASLHHYQYEKGMPQSHYDEGYYGGQPGITGTRSETVTTPGGTVRVVRRRNTANKKERRRTQSINTAFSDLRECIPNVPADTKLSKIKTLRLATSYISYLMGVLETDREPAGGFRAELVAAASGGGRRGAIASSNQQTDRNNILNNNGNNRNMQHNGGGLMLLNGEDHHQLDGLGTCKTDIQISEAEARRSKGRTGWPQHVWALELKQEQAL